jgi:hypothetical protein
MSRFMSRLRIRKALSGQCWPSVHGLARGLPLSRFWPYVAVYVARLRLAGSTTATAGPDQERRGRERWGLGNRSRQGSHSKLAPNHDIRAVEDCGRFLDPRDGWAERAEDLGWGAQASCGCDRPLDHKWGPADLTTSTATKSNSSVSHSISLRHKRAPALASLQNRLC